MKILVSTKETQGQRKNDFCFVPENELLMFGTACTDGEVDDNCGCRRALIGVNCSKGTTTFKVEERSDLTKELLSTVFLKALVKQGWCTKGRALRYKRDIDKMAMLAVKLADQFEVGSIIEKRDDQFVQREPSWLN